MSADQTTSEIRERGRSASMSALITLHATTIANMGRATAEARAKVSELGRRVAGYAAYSGPWAGPSAGVSGMCDAPSRHRTRKATDS